MAENKKSGFGSILTAGVLGAVAGAAAVFFSQEKNRNKTKQLVNGAKQTANEKLTQVKKELQKAKKTGTKKLVKELEKTQKKLEKEAEKEV